MPRRAYVTVFLNKKGKVVGVRQGRKVIRKKKGTPGQARVGGKSKSCDEIIKVLAHELLTCAKDGKGTDPCCYRDPTTGDEWCWC